MTGYIIGMVIGSLLVASGIAWAVYLNIKNRSFKKLVKSIGQKAEDKINADIKVWAKHTKNKFIPATLFKYEENKVFEVDSVLITDKAIIVVEIKSIRGGIKGDAAGAKWTKVLGEKEFPITNPITQNDKHISHIVKMSDIKVPMISLIIFSNRAEYMNISNTPPHALVIREVDLFNTLDQIDASLQQRLRPDEVVAIYKRIKGFKTSAPKDVKLHRDITTGKAGK